MRVSPKQVLAVVIVALVSSGVTWYTAQNIIAPPPTEKVVMALDWIPQGKHAMFFVAVDLGYYEKNGVSVTIIRGFGSGDTIQKVDQGRANFGMADAATLVVLRDKGAKVKEVGMTHHIGPQSVAYVKARGIETPKDLEGKIMGGQPGGAVETLMPAFARAAGFDYTKVKLITIDPATIVPALLSGKIDIAPIWIIQRPGADEAAAKEGKEIGFFQFAKYGLDVYSGGIVATESTINEKPDLVRRFVKASFEGLWWAIQNKGKAVDIIMKYHPELRREIVARELELFLDITMGPIIAKARTPLQLGWMDPAKMDRTAKIISELYGLKNPVKGEHLFINQFVEKLPD